MNMKMPSLGALVMAGLMACDAGPAVDLVPGVYVLSSVDGAAPPVVLRDDDGMGQWVLTSDTIFVFGGGRADRRTRIDISANPVVGDTVVNDRLTTNYRLIEGRLEVGYFPCPSNANCTPVPSGDLLLNGFTLELAFAFSEARTGVYLRAK